MIVILPDVLNYSDYTVFEISAESPRYNALIFEAISTLKEPNGSDVSAILSFIEV